MKTNSARPSTYWKVEVWIGCPPLLQDRVRIYHKRFRSRWLAMIWYEILVAQPIEGLTVWKQVVRVTEGQTQPDRPRPKLTLIQGGKAA